MLFLLLQITIADLGILAPISCYCFVLMPLFPLFCSAPLSTH